MAINVSQSVKQTRAEHKTEFALALIPFLVGLWSVQWAVIAGLVLACLLLVEMIRLQRMSLLSQSLLLERAEGQAKSSD